MREECAYTTIEYYPKSFNEESINVAFVFHNFTKGTLSFFKAKNKKRILSFDDEMTKEEYDLVMNSFEKFLKKPFNKDLFNYEYSPIVNDRKYLESVNHNFLNEFRFSKISYIQTEDAVSDMKDLLKLKLYYDYDKNERPKSQEIEKIIKKNIKQQLNSNNINYEMDYNVKGIGYGEPLKVDFKVGDKYIKILDSKLDNYTLKINTAKVWAYNKKYFDQDKKELIFAIANEPITEQEKTYIKILNEANATIFYIDDNISSLFSKEKTSLF